MIQNIFYFILALIGLGFLIFIHELGHYFIARRAKMTVEVFSIGFGKPFYKWNWHGVQWQICILPFGGFVRIKGMESKKKGDDLYRIPDGYFSKSPWKRIKVAFAGPFVNIFFALLAFSAIWMTGGREKRFAEKTGLMGWIDPKSKLYDEEEVRPGDQLTYLNKRAFKGFEDILFAAVLDGKEATLHGYKIDYYTGTRTPFDLTLPTYPHPEGIEQIVHSMGLLYSAGYLIYDQLPRGRANPLFDNSPMKESGVRYKDRILWADGHLIFSQPQLMNIVNTSTALLTVQRGEKTFVTILPRLKVADLQLNKVERGELDDWKHEAKLTATLGDLYFIAYNLNSNAVVENDLLFLGSDAEEHTYTKPPRTPFEIPLEKGDRILAIGGKPIVSSAQLLSELQSRYVQLIVQNKEKWPVHLWKEADAHFFEDVDFDSLTKMIESIGTDHPIKELNGLRLLEPVVPKTMLEFALPPQHKAALINEWEAHKKAIEAIKDPKERERALALFERDQHKLLLGITLRDQPVIYNPNPIAMTADVFSQMGRTFVGLVTGNLHPKQLSGPVGIVQVMHFGWSVGIKEGLYWLGLISLNLGILNLLPLPVLDGGHICFSLYEVITRKKINPKVFERIIIPFFVLLVLFFIYMVYSDISKLFTFFR